MVNLLNNPIPAHFTETVTHTSTFKVLEYITLHLRTLRAQVYALHCRV